MTISINEQKEGSKYTIYSIEEDGNDRVREYFRHLDAKRPKVLMRLSRALVRLAEHGPHPSEEKFKRERGKIFAIKEHQARVYCFFHMNQVFLTNAVTKKKNKANSSDLDTADRLRSLWIQSSGKSE